VAFTRGTNGIPYSLWVVERDGTGEVQLMPQARERTFTQGAHLVGDVVWASDDVLYFNTLAYDALAPTPRDDLYRANARIREVALLLRQGEGGKFRLSPDGANVAIVSKATYGRQDGRIGVIDALGQKRVTNLLYYVGVASGSHAPFYPDLFWSADGTALRVALPNKDLIYQETDVTPPPTELWELPIGTPSSRKRIGSVTASYFGLPVYNADASQMAYLARETASNRFVLTLAQGDGSNPQAYDEGELGSISAAHWLPSGARFWYAKGIGAFYVGAIGQSPTRLGDDRLRELLFLRDTAYLVIVQTEGAFEVQFIREGQAPLVLGSTPVIPAFDGVYP
jgi:hypothetical protein